MFYSDGDRSYMYLCICKSTLSCTSKGVHFTIHKCKNIFLSESFQNKAGVRNLSLRWKIECSLLRWHGGERECLDWDSGSQGPWWREMHRCIRVTPLGRYIDHHQSLGKPRETDKKPGSRDGNLKCHSWSFKQRGWGRDGTGQHGHQEQTQSGGSRRPKM